MTVDKRHAITIGDNEVVIRTPGRSTAAVAGILGDETRDGRRTLWLDRLVHSPGGAFDDGWEADGAVSTILAKYANY
jgi:hypothetical protein